MDQQAFLEHAIEQYGKATYNYAYRLTGNAADASDLTQEAYIRVYRAWESFKPGTSFLSWIYRIVTNLHRDELRRRKGRYQEEIPEIPVQPIEDYVEAQLSEPVSKALAELTPEQRQIVLLADIEECSYLEIARVVGCSVGTVRSRLHRARGQLRKLVSRYMKSSS
ncbi:MAG TPA: sigma-70 family RNA polymerase sigma factor [Candidatus Cybelea sp.]|nr:sigma-70 family RNA polymerase sigma factor [Candidatus Cybelea sp.]